jgi:hypothetical protein
MDKETTSGIARSLILFRRGQEIAAPRAVLELDSAFSCRRIDGVPYSIAENLAHAENWQRCWLAELGAAEKLGDDYNEWNWPKVEPSEWSEIRERFLNGLDRTIEIALNSIDDHTEFVLNQILIHDTYHIGQCVLLRRMLLIPNP